MPSFREPKYIIFFLASFLLKWNVSAQTPFLTADVTNTIQDSNPLGFTKLGQYVYFSAQTDKYGRELWRTDGVTTTLVKDIYWGGISSNPEDIYVHNDTLYFFANYGEFDLGFWKSDGTEAGTKLIRKFNSENNGGAYFVSLGNDLFFAAKINNGVKQLWKYNDINQTITQLTQTDAAYTDGIYNLTVLNNQVLFVVKQSSPVLTYDLWKSDGTTIGTYRLKTMRYLQKLDDRMLVFKNKAYFTGDTTTNYTSLWTTDGTIEGTTKVKHCDNNGSIQGSLYSSKDKFYFQFTSYTTPRSVDSLYESDGTPQGTKANAFAKSVGLLSYLTLLKYKNNLSLVLNSKTPTSRDILYEIVDDNFVYITDSNIYPNCCYRSYYFPSADGYFFVDYHPAEMALDYLKKGTTVAIRLKNDIFYEYLGLRPKYYYEYNDKILLNLKTTNYGRELWMTGNTIGSTFLVKDINNNTPSSEPYNLTQHENNLYYFTKVGGVSSELWLYNTTNTNSTRISRITTSAQLPYNLTSINGFLFFGQSISNGNRFWASTNSTTVSSTMDMSGAISNFKLFDNKILFRSGEKVFVTENGRPGTTTQLLSGNVNSDFTEFNDNLFFSHDSINAKGYELYKLTKPISNTNLRLVKDLFSGTANSNPNTYINTTNNSFFRAFQCCGSSHTLFKMNKNFEAEIVRDNSGNEQYVDLLVNFNDKIVYSSVQYDLYNGVYILRLNITDGSAVNTKNILTNRIITYSVANKISNLTVYKNNIYFTIYHPTYGIEIWKSDGTPSGTSILKDINTGTSSSKPSDFYVANGYLYFSAEEPSKGRELWRTNGTSEGTVMVYDLNEGNYSSNPQELKKIKDVLYFRANNGIYGTEVWGLNLNPCLEEVNVSSPINSQILIDADFSINANSPIINSRVKFDAGKYINLLPGFKVDNTSVFEAKIDGCGD